MEELMEELREELVEELMEEAMEEVMEEVMEELMKELMEEVMEEVMEVHHSQVLLWSDRRQLISGSRETQEPAVVSVYSVHRLYCTVK